MKVFVPMTDELLEQRSGGKAKLVPFNPEFLEARAHQGRKPANWIADTDYTEACKRLRNSQPEVNLVSA